MERLTFEGNFCEIARCKEVKCPYDTDCSQKQVLERLKAYEDTGIEPEAVETVKLALCAKHMVDLETLNNTPISRLVELSEADKDGRVVVLPCKVGDILWITGSIRRLYSAKVRTFFIGKPSGVSGRDNWPDVQKMQNRVQVPGRFYRRSVHGS